MKKQILSAISALLCCAVLFSCGEIAEGSSKNDSSKEISDSGKSDESAPDDDEINDISDNSSNQDSESDTSDDIISDSEKSASVQSANSRSSAIMKAANSALEEMDETGISIEDGIITHRTGQKEFESVISTGSSDLYLFMSHYLDNIEDCTFSFVIINKAAVCVSSEFIDNNNLSYYGAFPSIWNDGNDYPDDAALDSALVAAFTKYKEANNRNYAIGYDIIANQLVREKY